MSNLDTSSSESQKPLVKRFFENNYFVGLFIGVFVFCLVAIAYNYKLLDEFENTTLSWRYKYFNNNSKASDKCVIVGINYLITEKYGKWPFSRSVMADLVDGLNFYGAKSLTFDIIFADNNVYDRSGDLQLVEAAKRFQYSGKTIVFGSNAFMILKKNLNAYYSTNDIVKLRKLGIKKVTKIDSFKLEDVFSESNKADASKDIISGDVLSKENMMVIVLQKPFKDLFYNMNSIGLFNYGLKDQSTEVFSVPLVFEYNKLYFPSLALATYLNLNNNPPISSSGDKLIINNTKIPMYSMNKYMVNFYNPLKDSDFPYKSILLNEVVDSYRFLKNASLQTGLSKEEIQNKIEALLECRMKGSCPKHLTDFERQFPSDASITFRRLYKDKSIFVGLVDLSGGTKDLINTPVSKDIPGVYLHANILDNFLQKDFIYKVPRKIVFPLILLLTIITSIVTLGIKNSGYSIGFGMLCLCFFVVPLILFNNFNIYTDLFYTQTSIILTLGLSVIYKTWIIDKDKRLLKKQFSNYLSPQILNEILSDPSKMEMGGKRKEISILFSDIRGFTSISEKKEPEEVVSFLNEYFDAMVEEVLKTDGTVDKFIGDAVMAFWGAPVENKKHAEATIKSALGMIVALEEQKKKWAKDGKNYPEINIGIGINTGEALVGNVGSTKIKGYTIIGDAVNLASRLESLNKNYPNETNDEKSIIISEYTYQQVKDIFDVKYLDEVKVKGKDIGVKIYKVIGEKR